MGFWTRIFGAIICWGITSIAGLLYLGRYTKALSSLHISSELSVLIIACSIIAFIVVVVGSLFVWLHIWHHIFKKRGG